MGHTATEWSTKVLSKLNDQAEADVNVDDVFTIGVVPALTQFSLDQPRSVVVDLTPSGQYIALPATGDGWVTGWSDIVRLEAPAGDTPPSRLDQGEWQLTRDPSTPATQKVLLPFELAAGEKVRVFFTSTWPTPTTDATADLLSAPAFEAVSSLAASYVCTSLAASAASARQGALPTNFVDGSERARNLLDVAAGLRTMYNTFIGLGVVAGGGGSSVSSKALRSVQFG